MRRIGGDVLDRKRANLVELHRAVAIEPLMLGRDLSGAILKLPWRIGENGAEFLALRCADEVKMRNEAAVGEHKEI